MKKTYYTFEEIKEKFKEYRELKSSILTNDEYDLFCVELHFLPKEIVDRIFSEIWFVLLSADKKKGNPACYVPLQELIDEKRKGIIVLTPFIFASFEHKESGKIIEADTTKKLRILHEVAHHVLGHVKYETEEECEEMEKAVKEQVDEWITQFQITMGIE